MSADTHNIVNQHLFHAWDSNNKMHCVVPVEIARQLESKLADAQADYVRVLGEKMRALGLDDDQLAKRYALSANRACVPAEPTQAMLDACGFQHWTMTKTWKDICTEIWQSMLSAAPEPAGEIAIVCHAPGERCLGCDHYHGKAPVCKYAAPAGEGVPESAQQSSADEIAWHVQRIEVICDATGRDRNCYLAEVSDESLAGERVSVPRVATDAAYNAGLSYVSRRGTAWSVSDLWTVMYDVMTSSAPAQPTAEPAAQEAICKCESREYCTRLKGCRIAAGQPFVEESAQ